MILKIGDKAHVFSLDSDKGDHVSLRDFGGKHIVLFFFPKANTPG